MPASSLANRGGHPVLVAVRRRTKDEARVITIMTTDGVMSKIELVGESPVMVNLREQVTSAARTQAKVLILGETGTGKEVVARLIHTGGVRRGRPFIAVNCSGIPETLLESELFGHTRGSFTGAYRDKPGLVRLADGGSLFLDELGEMSLRMQAVLLRFAETGEVQPVGATGPSGRADVRLVTATNRNLLDQIAAREFREDLYYRLNVIQIRIPPLRERVGDVILLLRHFLRRASEAHRLPCPTLTPAAEQILCEYRWPGNVRELKNVTERLVVRPLEGPVLPHDLPEEIQEIARLPVHAESGEPAREPAAPAMTSTSPTVDRLWRRLAEGESFWSAVYEPFKSHDLTRADLRALIDRGLTETRGSYRKLLTLFQMPATDYKRFLAFLYQFNGNLPVQRYRAGRAHEGGDETKDGREQKNRIAGSR
ncbi:MAG: sigma-54-dependent Fis family transcriptional regulator [Blastocatellia bacterium]|nr:MAG: sigma-54-dependent Fis family transcriptional regulator [Blastocatellia bacterium]